MIKNKLKQSTLAVLLAVGIMTCERVGPSGFNQPSIKRCENSEVVCYTGYKYGMSCKFKGEK